jgi:hypothetical protein
LDSPSRPLLITALDARIDADATSELYARSLAVVWLLKQYAHAISRPTRRGGYVDMDAANPSRRARRAAATRLPRRAAREGLHAFRAAPAPGRYPSVLISAAGGTEPEAR